MRSRWIVAAAASLLLQGIVEAAEIKLFASGALKEAYLELIPAFEKASGHKVRLEWSSTTEIRKRVSAGEIHDLVILGDSGTEETCPSSNRPKFELVINLKTAKALGLTVPAAVQLRADEVIQ